MPRRTLSSSVGQLVAAAVVLILLMAPASALAQEPGTAPTADWPNCQFNCTANDVNLTGYWLGDVNGDPLPNNCTPGDPVTAYIWGSFHNNAGTERYAVILLAEIWEDGVLEHSFYTDIPAGFCSLDSIPAGEDYSAMIYGQGGTFAWTCGSVVEVRNSVVSWDTTSGVTCANVERKCASRGTSQCGRGVDLIVGAPLIADFSSWPNCVGAVTQFTNETTGGKMPYGSSWDFGDTGTSTDANPTHTYAATGDYDVKLDVTDSTVPPIQDSQTWPVSIWGNPAAAFAYAPNGVEKWQYQFTNGSTAATDKPCPEGALGYLWDFGDGLTSTLESPLHEFVGSQTAYSVVMTTTDGCGCTDTTQQRVFFTPNAVAQRNFKAASGLAPVIPLAAGLLAAGLLAAAGAVWRKKRS
jgi:PKD repeat protein